MKIEAPPKGTYHGQEEWNELLLKGVYCVDNGGICHPYRGADHHDMFQPWYKGQPEFYRRLSASQLLLLPEFREGIERRQKQCPVTAIEIHSPFDLDCVIAQWIFKKILGGHLLSGKIVPPIYHRLAHYANRYDRFILPYLSNSEYSLKGIMEGLIYACGGEEYPEEFFAEMDELLDFLAEQNLDPNSGYFLKAAEDMHLGKFSNCLNTVRILCHGVVGKQVLKHELRDSYGWENRIEEPLALNTRAGLREFVLVSLKTTDPEGVYELIYGNREDPSIVFLWNKEKNTPTVSARPDIVKHGVSLFLLITELDEKEEERAKVLNTVPVRWFDGVIYDGTVTYPLGKSNLTKEEIRDAIIAWAEKQKREQMSQPMIVLKSERAEKMAGGHKSVLAGFGGLPASGKSFIVDVLRDSLDLLGKQIVVVSSDAVRKETEKNPADDTHKGVGYGNDIYTDTHDAKNYTEIFRRAREARLEADLVVIDATLRKRELRRLMVDTCSTSDVMFGFVEISAPTEILLGRSAARWFKPSVSDATPDILEVQLKEYEELDINECIDPRVDFAVNFFNSDSPENMVVNTRDLVLWLLEIWFPEDVSGKKEEISARIENFIKRRLARLESKKIQPHADLLIRTDLLHCLKYGKYDPVIMTCFNRAWLDFLTRRVKNISVSGGMVDEARLLTQTAHTAILGAFEIVLQEFNWSNLRDNFLILGLEVKNLYSNLDFSIQPLDEKYKMEASSIYIKMKQLLRVGGWKVTPGSHLQRIVYNKTLEELKRIFVGCGCSTKLGARDIERGKTLLMVSKVLYASPEAEKYFRNEIAIPLLSDCGLRKAIVRVEAPKLKTWATFLPEMANMPDVKDVVTRGLYGLIELLRMRAQELNIEVEYALQNPLVAPKEEAAILLEAYDFCLRLRVAVQTFIEREEGLVVLDNEALESVARVLHFTDTGALLQEFSQQGQKVYEVAHKLLPEYY